MNTKILFSDGSEIETELKSFSFSTNQNVEVSELNRAAQSVELEFEISLAENEKQFVEDLIYSLPLRK